MVVFDGDCVLCSGFFRFLLRQDRGHKFRFVIAQSPLGRALYQELGLPDEDFETNLVLAGGAAFQKADAFAKAMAELGGIWRGLAWIRILPRWLKNPAYDLIARNRYRLFGRHDQCLMPDAALRARFVDGGF